MKWLMGKRCTPLFATKNFAQLAAEERQPAKPAAMLLELLSQWQSIRGLSVSNNQNQLYSIF